MRNNLHVPETIGLSLQNIFIVDENGSYYTDVLEALRVGMGASAQIDLDELKIPEGTPASATSTGTTGTILRDTQYLYICTATNTWARVAIATW